ncbi:FAD-dependent oxidoreductase [Shewanella sp. VB17]|uniref:NAD(P)/FAD-dependent oxidoreductase n=1 Tax=Shewanella sp. VB17 TaxID=2739432 RepID=UPI001562FF83|nr:FAD-dependent oxidoreductase [Shewanella sp. VB17]NRD74261.1 FAD-dependent oxidoreductase [Shewanella sp. VB17]
MKKIAIIGSGISGLTCAYLLDKTHTVTVFEKNDYVGGHTATVDIEYEAENYQIDTGFIVFNDRTYPRFNTLLQHLGVERQATEMSFSVHHRGSGFEYNGHGINALFAQRRNILKPKFWRLIFDIIRFNNTCKALYESDEIPAELTLGEFIEQHHFSEFFSQHYILPMGAAIWSTSLAKMKDFELTFFIQFFYHHGLLNIVDRPQWYVVSGGSRSYVKKLTEQLTQQVVLQASISGITRRHQQVQIHFDDGRVEVFDEVILACHSDQALALLRDPSDDEIRVLSGIPYQSNEVVLHTDHTLLPARKLAWASWNYMLDDKQESPSCVTYNMNILQGIKSDTVFCVTLNQTSYINPEKIIRRFEYDHPVLASDTVNAQKQRDVICGQQHTHFAGAYWYNGFHEDGVHSALDVTERFGVSL